MHSNKRSCDSDVFPDKEAEVKFIIVISAFLEPWPCRFHAKDRPCVFVEGVGMGAGDVVVKPRRDSNFVGATKNAPLDLFLIYCIDIDIYFLYMYIHRVDIEYGCLYF